MAGHFVMQAVMQRFAALSGAEGPKLQALLADAADGLKAAGLRVAGTLAETHGMPHLACSAGFLRDIGSGQAYAMFLGAPPPGTTCHLDAAGVEGACAAVLGQIAGSDVVVLSKFGKLEAQGGGLAPAFLAAMAAGKPILTSVSDLHWAAFHRFAPEAVRLRADAPAIRSWWMEAATPAT